MSADESDASSDPTRATKRRLAAELRGLMEDVVDRDLSDQAALELLAGLGDLRARAVGPHRPRYYEMTRRESARRSFADFSPVSGRSHPSAIPMTIGRSITPDGSLGVRARLRIGPLHEGPPHGVHGGVIAEVFDELFGHAQQVHDMQALTAVLTVRYRNVTPIDEDLEFFAQIVPLSGRRWDGKARCTARGAVTAEAQALFIGVDLDAIAARKRHESETSNR